MRSNVRRAEPADRPTLEIIRRQSVEASRSPRYDRERYADRVASPDEGLGDVLASDRYVCLLVETSATAAAYGAVDRSDGALRALYTAPDHAGRGFATRLLAELAESVEATSMTVDAPEPTVTFFASRGFERTGEPSSDPIPRVPMRRPLDR